MPWFFSPAGFSISPRSHAGGRARLVPWTEAGDHAHEKYRSMADAVIRVALRAAQAAMRDQLIFTGECAKQPPSSLIERAGFDMCVRAVAALIPEEAKP